jgi:hypothetical protein
MMNLKRYFAYFFLASFVVLLCFSCQRELHFDSVPSSGTLQSVAGDCLPKFIAATYVAGQAVGDSNYIEVTVDVTNPGSYIISTDIVNGYSFQGTGSFSSTGSTVVRLAASGTPLIIGIDNFIVTYNTSNCEIEVNVSTAVSTTVGYTLKMTAGSCSPATLSGSFFKDTALTSSNGVGITFVVTTPVAYTIHTDTVNGYSFSGSGVFTSAGESLVRLTGAGTPTVEGTDIFTIKAGTSSCTFAVTVTAAVPLSNDYFPLTQNSYWTYDDLLHPGDTLKRIMNGSNVTNGNTYQIMEEHNMLGGISNHLFRKAGDDYFEYGRADQ